MHGRVDNWMYDALMSRLQPFIVPCSTGCDSSYWILHWIHRLHLSLQGTLLDYYVLFLFAVRESLRWEEISAFYLFMVLRTSVFFSFTCIGAQVMFMLT